MIEIESFLIQSICTRWFFSYLEILPKLIGQAIAKLHNVGLVHGDITTSNIMLRRIPIEALESYVQIKNDSTNNDETAINKNVKDFVPFSVVSYFSICIQIEPLPFFYC